MRLHNLSFPESDVIGDRAGGASLSIRMETGAESVYFRLRDVTVQLDGNDAGLEFSLLTNSDYNRVRLHNGDGQQPERFYNNAVGGNPGLYVYYGDGDQGARRGRFEATLEFSFDDAIWKPLTDWPGTYTVVSGGFLAADIGPDPTCFWTALKCVTQECGRLPPVSDWTASGTNGHIFFSAPERVGNPGRIPLGYEAWPEGFRPLAGFARTLQLELHTGSFYEVYGAPPRSYVGQFQNIRIVRLAPQSGEILEVYPIGASLPITLVGQEANANGDTFRAAFDGDLPPLDPKFQWGVIADLVLDSSDPNGRPIRASVGAAYTFFVPTVFVVESGEFAFPLGWESEAETPFFAYSAWVNTLPCGDGAMLMIQVDGGEPKRLTFYHGCH